MRKSKGPGPAGKHESPTIGPPLAYSVCQLEEESSLGRTTIYALMKANILSRIKVGRRTLITHESWQQALETLTKTGGKI